MSDNETQLRLDIVEVGRRLWSRGFVASNDGNISVRLSGDRLLMTPTSVSKGFMDPEMMVVTDMEGRLLSGAPGRKPSSEILMHLVAYQRRPDVNAVVHAHPPQATGFAVAGIPLDRAVLAEVVTTLGSIPIAAYGTPSTPELPEAVKQYVGAHDGMLLANHGALALGKDLYAAYYKMETIEHFARISLTARLLGREHLLSQEEVGRLQALRDSYGIAAPAPVCVEAPAPSGGQSNAPSRAADAKMEEEICQTVVAPKAPSEAVNARLIADTASNPNSGAVGTNGEIQLTYGELTALIDGAVKHLTARNTA